MGDPEVVLGDKATAEEHACNWENAIKIYTEAIESSLNENDEKSAGSYYMKLGNAYEQAGFTVETTEKFLEFNKKSKDIYKKAEKVFKETGDKAEELECIALGMLVEKEFNLNERKPIISKILENLLKSNEFYSKTGDKKSSSRVLYTAVGVLAYIISLTEDKNQIEELYKKATKLIEEAKEISSKINAIENIVKILRFEMRIFQSYSEIIPFRGINRWREYLYNLVLKFDELLTKVDEIADISTLTRIYFTSGYLCCFYGYHYIVDDEVEQSKYMNKGLELFDKALQFARKTKNKQYILECLRWMNWWAIFAGRQKLLQKRIAVDIQEIEQIGKIFGTNPLLEFISNIIVSSYYSTIAYWDFYSSHQRKSFAEKAIEYAEKDLTFTILIPSMVHRYINLTFAHSLLAVLSVEKDQKDFHLKAMLENANKANSIGEKFEGGFAPSLAFYSQYVAYRTLARLIENDVEKAEYLLRSAEMMKNYIPHALISRSDNFNSKMELGLIYEEIGILTKELNKIKEASEIFRELSKETIEKGYFFIASQCHEYLARLENRLGNFTNSFENYENAIEAHKLSLEIIQYKPHRDKIRDKIQYNQAWSLIERAKLFHKSEKHSKAKECYEEASEILKGISKYDFEGYYYAAWALLEEGERLSKLERPEEAIYQYEMTIKVFEDVIKKLRESFTKAADQEEKDRINKLEKVASIRINYCSARVNLEKGRILGKQGDHSASADLFASAASTFRSVCTKYKLEREKKELEAIYYLCRAWESMELAEKYGDPERFAEASNLFTKSSNLFTETKFKLLSSGNSAFCQALELGCKFDEAYEANVKSDLYSRIRIMLRKAATSYDKGGFNIGADWALATSTYFDAAWHLIKADEELDLDERAKLLGIGSRYLQSAANLFGKAGYIEKEKEVQDRLKRLEKEESILLSALGTITKPTISSSTLGISAPSCPIESSQSPILREARELNEEERRSVVSLKRPAQLIDETPVVILITTKGGIPLFSYVFADEWKFDDELFSGFLSSFDSISNEIFSEGLDRAKFGQYTILMKSVEDFSVCYLFKGQVFSATEKLTRFINHIQESTSIWKTLNKSYKTSQVVELRDIPLMEPLLNDVFLSVNS